MSEEKSISKLKDEVKAARALSFMDFNDQGESGRRVETVKVLDTISRLELEVQKAEDDLRLREEDLECKHIQDEERTKLERDRFEFEKEKILEELRLKREQEENRKNEEAARYALDVAKREEESEYAKKKWRLDIVKTGLEGSLALYTARQSFDYVKMVFKNKDEAYLVDRACLDAARRSWELAGKGFRKLRF